MIKKKEFFYGGCGGEGENLLPEIRLKIRFSEGGVNFDDLGLGVNLDDRSLS